MSDARWKVAIVKDTAVPMFGLHGLHTAFQGLPNVEVIAHIDSNAENIEKKMSFTGAQKYFSSLEELFEDESPNIAVLCSRHPADHFEQIKFAAEKKCHIFCEKPLSASLEEIDEIIKIAESNGIHICMAHPCRYSLAFLTMKAMIESGEIGTPLQVYGRSKCDYRGGGEDMLVLGTHILDLQAFLFGEPQSVYAEVTANGQPITKNSRSETAEPVGPAAGDRVFAAFQFPHEVRGVFTTQKGLYERPSRNTVMGVTVSGTKGSLMMRFDDYFDRHLWISRRPCPPEYDADLEKVLLSESRVIPGAEPREYSKEDPDIPKIPLFVDSMRYAVWDLITSIKENRQPVSNVYSARTALEMIYGIYRSSLTERKIMFPIINRSHPLGR
jgi:predicted dehydrogenase